MNKIATLFCAALVALSVSAANVTVADGTETSTKLPLNGYYCDVQENHTQVIYPATDLADISGHNISALTFYAKNAALSWGAAEFVVKVAEVDESALSDFLSPSFTEVYAGKLAIVSTFLEINFSTKYAYSGKNLLIDISQSNKCSYSDANEPTFFGVSASGAGYGNKIGSYGMASTADFRPKVTITHDGNGAAGTCDQPTKVKVTITPDGGIFAWEGEAGAQYQWCVVAKGADAAGWALLEKDVFTCTVSGLSADKEYDFCVRTFCSESLQSEVVRLNFAPVCNAPENIVLGEVSTTEAALSWDAVTGIELFQFVCVEKDAVLSWSGVEAKKGLSAKLTDLDPATEYDFYVRSYFSAEVQSAPTKISFMTDCEVKNMPFREAFMGESLPICWEIRNKSSYGWEYYTDGEEMSGNSIRYNAKGLNGTLDTLCLPAINLEKAMLKMNMKNIYGVSVQLFASTDDGKTLAEVADLTEKIDESTEKRVDLSKLTGVVRLYFIGTADGKFHYCYLDNIQVVESDMTGIDTVSETGARRKSIQDGMLIIEHNGKRYNAQGAEVK